MNSNELFNLIQRIDDEHIRTVFLELYDELHDVTNLEAREQLITDKMLEAGLVERA